MDRKNKPIRVGSRKSELALIQTKHVVSLLQHLCPQRMFEIHTMTTIGDRVLNISLPKIGEKSLFTRDLEDALRNGGIDLVVHSLKDLPTALPTGMTIGAVLEREDARDALVLRKNLSGYTISTLPTGSVIGTSSLRRASQIRRQYPHLNVCDIRGNLNTRLAKLDAEDSKFSGIILAQAGLVRMGWQERISQTLEPTDLLYAVGQGALAVECRAKDVEILSMLRSLMCLPTTCKILAERSFLKTLGGGCSAPVAVLTNLKGNLAQDGSCTNTVELHLHGAVWSLDGSEEIRQNLSCTLVEPNTDEPPIKRTRTKLITSTDVQEVASPPVISDDAVIISNSFNINDLVDKHINIAKQCVDERDDCKISTENCKVNDVGGGDVRNTVENCCPLSFDIGQDFMGKCPFVGPENKVSYGYVHKSSLTSQASDHSRNPDTNGNEAECVPKPSSSRCPFSSMHSKTHFTSNTKPQKRGHVGDDLKCPFLQKTVQMFDYAEQEKLEPNANKISIEDVDNLFCGLFHHDCYDGKLFARSKQLGQELAENLIKKGALNVMKIAQSEIHSKVYANSV